MFKFLPLIALFSLDFIFVLIRQFFIGYNIDLAMRDFMGGFFVLFGFLKVINIRAFADSYSLYDLIAQKFKVWAYIYPFVELILGFMYLFDLHPFFLNIFTATLMLIGAVGVVVALVSGKKLMCACLGEVFKVPLTYVTLMEDLLMAVMALYMLFKIN